VVVSVGDLSEVEAGLRRDSQPTGGDQRPDELGYASANFRLLSYRTSPQAGCGDRGAFGEQPIQVQGAFASALQADDDQSAVGGQRGHIRLYLAPITSRITSTPPPSVASVTAAAQSSW